LKKGPVTLRFSVINLSSVSGIGPAKATSMSGYNASKCAVRLITSRPQAAARPGRHSHQLTKETGASRPRMPPMPAPPSAPPTRQRAPQRP